MPCLAMAARGCFVGIPAWTPFADSAAQEYTADLWSRNLLAGYSNLAQIVSKIY
jgi:hypothetical protein